jgi:hypothetical protein
VDTLPVHELSAVNGQSLRFKYRATGYADDQYESIRRWVQLDTQRVIANHGSAKDLSYFLCVESAVGKNLMIAFGARSSIFDQPLVETLTNAIVQKLQSQDVPITLKNFDASGGGLNLRWNFAGPGPIHGYKTLQEAQRACEEDDETATGR